MRAIALTRRVKKISDSLRALSSRENNRNYNSDVTGMGSEWNNKIIGSSNWIDIYGANDSKECPHTVEHCGMLDCDSWLVLCYQLNAKRGHEHKYLRKQNNCAFHCFRTWHDNKIGRQRRWRSLTMIMHACNDARFSVHMHLSTHARTCTMHVCIPNRRTNCSSFANCAAFVAHSNTNQFKRHTNRYAHINAANNRRMNYHDVAWR